MSLYSYPGGPLSLMPVLRANVSVGCSKLRGAWYTLCAFLATFFVPSIPSTPISSKLRLATTSISAAGTSEAVVVIVLGELFMRILIYVYVHAHLPLLAVAGTRYPVLQDAIESAASGATSDNLQGARGVLPQENLCTTAEGRQRRRGTRLCQLPGLFCRVARRYTTTLKSLNTMHTMHAQSSSSVMWRRSMEREKREGEGENIRVHAHAGGLLGTFFRRKETWEMVHER